MSRSGRKSAASSTPDLARAGNGKPRCYGLIRCSHEDSRQSGLGLDNQTERIKRWYELIKLDHPDLEWGGLFKDEVVPTWGLDEAGHRQLFTVDQTIRPETNPEVLAKLSPAFNPKGGLVTAGNSSPLTVGASALLMMSEERAKELGLTPKVKIRSMAVAGVEPCEMGIGPAKATPKALERSGVSIDDIDAIELNEAFASQSLAVIRLANFDPDKVNTRGGAIALGHPLGSSGARIVVTLIHRMTQDGNKLGLATLCVGGGMGEATIVEAC